MLLKGAHRSRPRTGRLIRLAVLGAALLALLALTYIIQGLSNPNYFSRSWLRAEYGPYLLYPWDHGHQVFDNRVSLVRGTIMAVPRLLSGLNPQNNDLPDLALDIKFKNMRQIYQERDEALLRGRIVQTDDSFVKGEIRTADDSIPIKLRLKGDLTDHLQGRKWSFRIHTRRGRQFLGMRRFSIQHPKVRGYHSENLYFDALRYCGVLTPRYLYANVILNGEDIGIMAVEEHFSKELLESQSRREGIIIRYDEDLLFVTPDRSTPTGLAGGIYDDYLTASIDAFQTGKVLDSPLFSKHLATATGLLRGFTQGQLPASDVFDAELLGRYLAVSDVFGAQHAIRWHNQRFYFNPITLKLEPVAYDASLKQRDQGSESSVRDEPIAVHMLRDPLVRRHYLATLQELAAELATDGALYELLAKHEAELLQALRTEFIYLQGYPLAELSTRAVDLADTAEQSLFTAAPEAQPILLDPRIYEQKVWAYQIDTDVGPALELTAAIPFPVTVNSLTTDIDIPATAIDVAGLPLQLPARQRGSEAAYLSLPLGEEVGDGPLWLNVSIESRNFAVPVRRYYPALTEHPIPQSSSEDIVARYPFLALDPATNMLRAAPGDWTINEVIGTPPGIGLELDSGTRLRFGESAGLVIRGPVDFHGSEADPVYLGPATDGTWLGVAVMEAGAESSWQHVEVELTSGMELGPWKLMGGNNFYRSPVVINDSAIRHHRGEDGLNIITTRFTINNLEIQDTLSDGFDCDFCEGDINGGLFREIGTAGGGDAIDVSVSNIRINGVRFRDVDDKAVSIGEQSTAEALGLDIEACGTGAAAKDGSFLRLGDSRIHNSSVSALMAYIKKPEFGAAELIATDIDFAGNRTVAVAQTGSSITIDGVAVPPEDVDVDELYDTIMRPGLRRPPAAVKEASSEPSNEGI